MRGRRIGCGPRVVSLRHIAELASECKSVVFPAFSKRPYAARHMLKMAGSVILERIDSGTYVYEEPQPTKKNL